MISQAKKPSAPYTGRIDHLSERLIGEYSYGVVPTGAQPYFRSPVRSFAADSSRKISWDAVYFVSLSIHASLSSGLRSAASIISEFKSNKRIRNIPFSLTNACEQGPV